MYVLASALHQCPIQVYQCQLYQLSNSVLGMSLGPTRHMTPRTHTEYHRQTHPTDITSPKAQVANPH